MTFHLPTKPYSVIDAINRAFVATGSPRCAAAHSGGGDFNGHFLTLSWNDYRKYYVGEYSWAGRNVLVRGTDFAYCLAMMKREYEQQGRGSTLVVTPKDDADAETCRKLGLVEGEEDVKACSWWKWQHEHVSDFMCFDRHFSCPTNLFLEATSYEDFNAKFSAHMDARRAPKVAVSA